VNIITHIFSVKFIISFALASVFMTTIADKPARAATCPCPFISTLFQAKKNFRRMGVPFPPPALTCTDAPSLGQIVATTGPSIPPDEEDLFRVATKASCPANEFCCLAVYAVDQPPAKPTQRAEFDLLFDITEEQHAACRQKIRAIIQWQNLDCPE